MTDRAVHAAVTGDSGEEIAALVASHTLDVADFPEPGILFKDLTPVFADGAAFRAVVDAIVAYHGPENFDVVVGIEARGFMVAAAVAYANGAGVVPVRKAGKLPRATYSVAYALEYGEATLEVHEDAFTSVRSPGSLRQDARDQATSAGQRVLVIDDVLATGGTAAATMELVERAGGTVVGFSVLLELEFLQGRKRLAPRPVHALLTV